MGAIAEAFVAFAQPLFDQTDGSPEQLNKALGIAQICYNLALLSNRDEAISEMRSGFPMDDQEFDEFRRSVILPMIRRHEEMFPAMHGRVSRAPSPSFPSPQVRPRMAVPPERAAVTDRYAPCPCNSGKNTSFVVA